MRYSALPFVFCLFCVWVGLQTLRSASATLLEQQEQRAEMLCTLNPEQCGSDSRYDATIR